jgi:hypothetical protein
MAPLPVKESPCVCRANGCSEPRTSRGFDRASRARRAALPPLHDRASRRREVAPCVSMSSKSGYAGCFRSCPSFLRITFPFLKQLLTSCSGRQAGVYYPRLADEEALLLLLLEEATVNGCLSLRWMFYSCYCYFKRGLFCGHS